MVRSRRFVVALAAVVFGATATHAQQLPQTWQEQQAFRSGPTPFEPLMKFWYELDAMSDIVSMQPLTRTLLGREMPLIIIAEPAITNPQDALRSGKTIVLLAPSVHGGEVSPKEATQLIAKELVAGELRPLLRDVIVLALPLVNPDGGEVRRRTIHDPLEHCQTVRCGEQSTARLPLAHFGREIRRLGLCYVRRIRDDDVELSARRRRVPQIALAQCQPFRESGQRCILACEGQRVQRQVRRDRRRRFVLGEDREGDRAGAGAEIEDARRGRRMQLGMLLQVIQHHADQHLRLRPRNECAAVHLEPERPEFNVARNVLQRLVLQPAPHARPERLQFRVVDGPVELRVQLEPLHAEHPREQQLRLEPRVLEATLAKELRGLLRQCQRRLRQAGQAAAPSSRSASRASFSAPISSSRSPFRTSWS